MEKGSGTGPSEPRELGGIGRTKAGGFATQSGNFAKVDFPLFRFSQFIRVETAARNP